jgi:hypothetical protein
MKDDDALRQVLENGSATGQSRCTTLARQPADSGCSGGFHRLESGPDTRTAAVREAVVSAPHDPGYRSDWPNGTAVDLDFAGKTLRGRSGSGCGRPGRILVTSPAG